MEFLKALWEIILELAPFLLLGLLIAGLLNAFVPRSAISKHLGKHSWWTSVKAALIGIPLPLCSCGVIPTGVALKKSGASNGATVSFLVSTPQTGVDSLLVTYSMMGLPWAIFRPIVALVSGILAGQLSPEPQDEIEIKNPEVDQAVYSSLWERIFRYAFVDFLQDISRPLITGILLAAAITWLIPDSLFTEYLNQPLLAMLVVLAASVPLYVCATGSVPIGAALLLKGLSPGAVLVFLMAGPVTNAATISVLYQSLGKKVTLVYAGSIIVFSLAFGILVDYTAIGTWLTSGFTSLSHHHHLFPEWLNLISAFLLIALLVYVEINRLIPKRSTMENIEHSYKIEGMTCNHCKANVERSLSQVSGIEAVEVDLSKGQAQIKGNPGLQQVKEAVESIGYLFKGEV